MEPGRITAEGGQVHINSADGAKTAVGAYCFVVQEDTVISVLLGGTTSTDTGTDFKTSMGLTGKTLKQGAQFFAPISNTFNSITLTSGSIIAYKL